MLPIMQLTVVVKEVKRALSVILVYVMIAVILPVQQIG
jgi:hypothetical protein